jgi:hypothetical protein
MPNICADAFPLLGEDLTIDQSISMPPSWYRFQAGTMANYGFNHRLPPTAGSLRGADRVRTEFPRRIAQDDLLTPLDA